MKQRSFKHLLSLPLVLTAALLTLQAQPVELQYAPADGAVFNVVETVSRVTTASGADPVTDVRQRESIVTIAAVTASDSNSSTTTTEPTGEAVPESTAFSNNVVINSQSLTRNDDIVASPMHAALSGLDLTYHLDANGKLLEIAGYEKLGDSISAALPDKLAGTLLKLVNHDTLLYRDKANYEEVYGPFTTGSVTPVVNAVSAAIQALPYEGSVVLFAVETIESLAADGKIRVTRSLNTDAAALASQFDGLEEATILATQGTLTATLPANCTSASVSGSETVLVQVSGALVESRTLELDSEWTLQAPDGTTAATHRVKDTKEFTVTNVPVSVD